MGMSTKDMFTPKSVFRGVNSDGTKYKMEEWEPGSISGGDTDGAVGYFVGACLALIAVSVISPIALLIALIMFKGRIMIANIIGIVVGFYFLYDNSHGWICTRLLKVTLRDRVDSVDETCNMLVSLTIASIVCHIIMFIIPIYTNGELYEVKSESDKVTNKLRIIMFIGVVFLSTYFIVV